MHTLSTKRTFSFIAWALLFLGACSAPVTVDTNNFYAPKLIADENLLILTVPVEIAERDGQKSFVKLFELYGFSGNGPSIEQVIKHNVPQIAGRFDSEGDAFSLTVSNKPDFEAMRTKLKCIEQVPCLATWLAEAKSILFKE